MKHVTAQTIANTEADVLLTLDGKETKLHLRGKEYQGLCPFHKEETPSFTVQKDMSRYHCFGCGASGKLGIIPPIEMN